MNLQGLNDSVASEVKLTRHMTDRAHSKRDGCHYKRTFVFRDNFEAILNMLEEDEASRKHFSTAAMDVSILYENFSTYFGCSEPKCIIHDSDNNFTNIPTPPLSVWQSLGAGQRQRH